MGNGDAGKGTTQKAVDGKRRGKNLFCNPATLTALLFAGGRRRRRRRRRRTPDGDSDDDDFDGFHGQVINWVAFCNSFLINLVIQY